MDLKEIRIYAEVLEQGIDFKEYLQKIGFTGKIVNCYTKKGRDEFNDSDSVTDRIRKCKDIDVLLTAIISGSELPLLLVEYSTAVPTDDHKMQRSDVYFWGSVFHVPMLKIYPSNKGMDQNFGGGDRFTDEIEEVLAFRKGAIFYPVQWNTYEHLDVLKTKENALSCIYFSEEIEDVLKDIVKAFNDSLSYSDYFCALRGSYKIKKSSLLEKYDGNDLSSVIVNSARFNWEEDKLTSKINRFGHAMDPDRGILYFTNMLVGVENCITEIQVNRPDDFNSRGGYKSLFDATPHKVSLENYVRNIIRDKNNVFDDEDALFIFKRALNIDGWDLFQKQSNHSYFINDDELLQFLTKCPSMTSKCIFFLSTKLKLTDKNRNTICSVSWNKGPIQAYLDSVNTENHAPIVIKELTFDDAKEDIVTFASVQLYKKIQCDLLAVSYPGAQGDRCVLLGDGRNVLRTYIDIIAIKKNQYKATVFLEECKDDISKSKEDVTKLNNFLSDSNQIEGLQKLVRKIDGCEKIDNIKISVGAKFTPHMPNYQVDYIFLFDINNSSADITEVDYTVALIDTTLFSIFKPLTNPQGKLRGKLIFDKIFAIK